MLRSPADELDLIVTSCLEKKRELRPQRISALLEAFEVLALEHRWPQPEAEACWRLGTPLAGDDAQQSFGTIGSPRQEAVKR